MSSADRRPSTVGCGLTAILLVIPSPTSAQIPTPASVLGFEVGADLHLATYEESIEYFQLLDAASDKISLIDIGQTSEGRAWFVALISSPQNLADIETYRGIAQRLAHPDGLTDADARRLARQGKALVHIDGGLHASEVAGAQHTIQLAHDLVAATDDPAIDEILENVIVMVWPSINPDGQSMVANWYRSNVGTPYEVAPLPRLYQKYIGHDNNRDAYMLNMIESRVIGRTWRHWEPHIIYVHHQTAPFPTRIWLPPFAEPIATQAPPLMSRTVNMIGMAIAHGLELRGLPGATHMGTGFDAWYPGYVDYLPMLQHIASFWTETALYRYATPRFYTLNDFPPNRRDLRAETLYSSPWQGGWWHLSDAVEYMRVASLSVLSFAAKYREELLYGRYQSGRDVIAKYRAGPPYAYFITQDQRDPVAAAELLRRLAFNGIRISQLANAVTHESISYPPGTWVIPMDQEFAELARQVLATQSYPDLREFPSGPPEQPYDAAGWTLPYMMDVRVIAATQPLEAATMQAIQPVRGTPADWTTADDSGGTQFDSPPGVGFDTDSVAVGIVPPAGTADGSGNALVVDAAQNNSFRAINRALASGGTVRFQPGTVGADGQSGTSGRYVISGLSGEARDAMVKDFALRAARIGDSDGVSVQPSIGLFRPWSPSMDEGWTRWLLEQYGFSFRNLTNADVRGGDLRSRFDVIILASDRPRTIMEGYADGTVPPRYAGGIGDVGARALDRFVREGGTLVCFNASTAFAIEQFHLPVENVVGELGRGDFFASGSIFEVITDPSHPVMTGMPERAKIFFDRSPVFTTQDGFEGRVLAKYAEHGSPLLSGYLLGEEYLQGYAAAVDVKRGDGHVVLVGFRPQWRGQTFGTFKVLFNAVLYGAGVAGAVPDSSEFWSAPDAPKEGNGS